MIPDNTILLHHFVSSSFRMSSVQTSSDNRPLDFQDIISLDESQRVEAIKALGPIMTKTFASLDPSWSMAVHKRDQTLRHVLRQWFRTVADPMVKDCPATEYCFDFALALGESCFTTMDYRQRLTAAKVNSLAAIIDDQIQNEPGVLKECQSLLRNLVSGRRIKSPIVSLWSDCFREHADLMKDPVVSDYLYLSYLNYMVGFSFEAKTEKVIDVLKLPLLQSGSTGGQVFPPSNLPYFIRTKTGFAESWALALFSQDGDRPIPMEMFLPLLPDVIHFANMTNDMLSAPKEIMKGEAATYLNYTTYSKGQVRAPGSGCDGLWCFEDSFVEMCAWFVEIVNRLDSVVISRYELERVKDCYSQEATDAKFLRDTWMTFKAGMIEMHFDFERYDVKGWLPEVDKLRHECRELHACKSSTN